jgi:hypothetical protein
LLSLSEADGKWQILTNSFLPSLPVMDLYVLRLIVLQTNMSLAASHRSHKCWKNNISGPKIIYRILQVETASVV